MTHTTASADDTATTNATRARNEGSGLFEIDVREGFERIVRNSTENALTCYREAAKARAAGDELEALGLCELAEQSLDLASDLLCRIEGL
jgi:hypothetical protein